MSANTPATSPATLQQGQSWSSPLVKSNGELYGVLDLDAPVLDRFDDQLVAYMTAAAAIIMKAIDEAA